MRPKAARGWTPRERLRLEELRLCGNTVRQIAAELGRSCSSIACACARWQVPGFSSSRLAYLNAFREPHTLAGLAKRFGVSKRSVAQAKWRLRRAGFVLAAADREGAS